MTTQEAIEKLENYDELEGKYNEALARIDEYERERTEVLAKIAITKEEIKKAGMISKALNYAINMLEPPASEDEIKVGDIVKTEHWKKTGKSCPQIAEILSKVRGENDESKNETGRDGEG